MVRVATFDQFLEWYVQKLEEDLQQNDQWGSLPATQVPKKTPEVSTHCIRDEEGNYCEIRSSFSGGGYDVLGI